MQPVTRMIDFPEWSPEHGISADGWTRWEENRWLLPLATPLPAMITPWVRLVDYSLPGYVETEVPEGWGTRIAQWEQALWKLAARSPPPCKDAPRTAAEWKRAVRSWCRPSAHADRWNGVWYTPSSHVLPVYVGAAREPSPAAEALVPRQWIKMKIRLLGVLWDGQAMQLALVVDQVLVRQTWREDVREMALRALESMRTTWLIGPQEEKILSLLDISSR